MKDNRRDFIKKSASLAAAFSVGGLGTAVANAGLEKAKANIVLNSMAKDAGMEMSTAYFSGIEANRQLIELAKQMDALGAVAGIDSRITGLTDVKPYEYKAIAAVREAWKKVGLNYTVVEGPPS